MAFFKYMKHTGKYQCIIWDGILERCVEHIFCMDHRNAKADLPLHSKLLVTPSVTY